MIIGRFSAPLLLLAACANVTFVERVSIANDTKYPATVEVRGVNRGWLPITTVSSGEKREVAEVIDQGQTWTFRFAYAGQEVEVEFRRGELAAAQWLVEVPLELEERLHLQGIPPPP